MAVNLGLPVVPEVNDEELFKEALRIYIAIRAIAENLGGTVVESDSAKIAVSQLVAQLISMQSEISKLKQQMTTMVAVIPWQQPEPIGSEVPNDITATELIADNVTVAATVTAVDVNSTNAAITTLTATDASIGDDLTVVGDSLLGRVGFNGNAASAKIALPIAAVDPATTMALSNSLRSLAITFGLGV